MISPHGEPGAVLTLMEEERIKGIADRRFADVLRQYPDAVLEKACPGCGNINYRVDSQNIAGVVYGPFDCDVCKV